MKIVLATDAWEPQINGVVRTLKKTVEILESKNHEVYLIHPDSKKSIKCPFTNDVRLGTVSQKKLKDLIRMPCCVHIATKRNNIPFTTAYHTKFPEFVNIYTKIPIAWTRKYINWFHNSSSSVMVASAGLMEEIKKNGVKSPIRIWNRGVDFDLFYPRIKNEFYEKPVALFVGRISKEKNLEAFFDLKIDFQKIVVGDGPELNKYKSIYKDVIFKGSLHGQDLAQSYCNADVFVFPSISDTFGLVVIESLACGTPVACYPVVGPGDIINNDLGIGCSSWNLEEAIIKSLSEKNSNACFEFSKKYSWEKCTQQFLENLIPVL